MRRIASKTIKGLECPSSAASSSQARGINKSGEKGEEEKAMAPLCADNNNLIAYHMPLAAASTRSSEASLMAIAQQFMQQQQQQAQMALHPPPEPPVSSSMLHQLDPSSPSWQAAAEEEFGSHSFYTDAVYDDFNPSGSTPFFNDPPSEIDLSPPLTSSATLLVSSSSEILPTPTEMRPSSPSEYQSLMTRGLGVEEDSLAFLTSSSTAINAASCYDSGLQDVMSAEWMDCLMYDAAEDGGGMVGCFDTNPCESSQSSEPANSCYPCTPAEEALPDGFIALEAAMRCMQQQQQQQQQQYHHPQQQHHHQRSSHSEGVSPSWATRDTSCSPASQMLKQQQQQMMSGPMMTRGRGATWPQQRKACASSSSSAAAMDGGKVPAFGVQLMQLLLDCAKNVDSDQEKASSILPQLRALSTTHGDPIQRLAAYFTEALSKRLARGQGAADPRGSSRFPGLSSPQDLTLAHKALNDACPYFTFAQLTANQAILEATEGAHKVHIVDFGISQGVQWAALLQAMAGRPSLARVRITGVASPDLGKDLAESLAATGHRLVEFGRALELHVEFRALEVGLGDEKLSARLIDVEEGEVVAVNFMLELCNLLDGDDSKVARVLQVARQLSPKVATVAEMDAHLNKGAFQKRFVSALHFFSAMFDSLEAGMGRDCPHRFRMEWWLLGERILSMVGADSHRRRLQPHDQWRAAMEAAGFRASPLSRYAVSQARILLWRFCDSFTLADSQAGLSLSLGWQNKPLLTVSSWTTTPTTTPPPSP